MKTQIETIVMLDGITIVPMKDRYIGSHEYKHKLVFRGQVPNFYEIDHKYRPTFTYESYVRAEIMIPLISEILVEMRLDKISKLDVDEIHLSFFFSDSIFTINKVECTVAGRGIHSTIMYEVTDFKTTHRIESTSILDQIKSIVMSNLCKGDN